MTHTVIKCEYCYQQYIGIKMDRFFLLPTSGSQSIPPLYPLSCSSLPPLAHSIWPALHAKSKREILTCKQGQKKTTPLWIWLQFLRGEVYVVIHQKEHIWYLTLELKKRTTWVISKFWSAQNISRAICELSAPAHSRPSRVALTSFATFSIGKLLAVAQHS